MTEKLTPCAQWTDDCQGKKDYDGRLLSISTRYWPGPGSSGTMVVNAQPGQAAVITTAPYGTRPSATATICLNHGAPDHYGYGDSLVWREKDFEADTEAEVKALVEAWVQERFDEVVALLGFGPQLLAN